MKPGERLDRKAIGGAIISVRMMACRKTERVLSEASSRARHEARGFSGAGIVVSVIYAPSSGRSVRPSSPVARDSRICVSACTLRRS